MLPNFSSAKGLNYSNLKPEKLKYDWVLDRIICYADVYLGRNYKPGWWGCGNRFVRGPKKDLRLRGRLVVLTGTLVDQEEGKPDLGRFLRAESRAAVESWFVFIDKWKASFTLEDRMFFSGDQKTWVLKQRLEEIRKKTGKGELFGCLNLFFF